MVSEAASGSLAAAGGDLARRTPTLEVTIEIIVYKESSAAADRARRWKHGRPTDILSIY
jgi:hypothetical protein